MACFSSNTQDNSITLSSEPQPTTPSRYESQICNAYIDIDQVDLFQVTAENSVSSVNDTLTLSVENMNLLASLEFVNNPAVAETDTNIELQATVILQLL